MIELPCQLRPPGDPVKDREARTSRLRSAERAEVYEGQKGRSDESESLGHENSIDSIRDAEIWTSDLMPVMFCSVPSTLTSEMLLLGFSKNLGLACALFPPGDFPLRSFRCGTVAHKIFHRHQTVRNKTIYSSLDADSRAPHFEHVQMAENIYDEIEIEDMTYDPALEIYHYPCPCGDKFEITIADLRDGEDIAVCPSCSLMIRVIFEVVRIFVFHRFIIQSCLLMQDFMTIGQPAKTTSFR